MSDLIITGVIDGPLTGGTPKAVELFVVNDIPDLSIYGLGSANNGGGTDGQEFTLSGSATAGTYIYIASEAPQFTTFFGFAPTFTNGAANINGDDAIELFLNGTVVDVFGDINLSGTGQPWEYTDGWAYRVDGTGPDGTTFTLANWTFSGVDALDLETSNATATPPFPTGNFMGNGGGGGGTGPFFTESFEAAPGTTYTLSNPFSFNNSFFDRFPAPDNTNVARDDFQTGFDGSFAIFGQDHDGTFGAATRSIFIDNIDITGRTDLRLTAALGALASEPSFFNFEPADGDGIRIFATIDGGTQTQIARFSPSGAGTGGAGDLRLDANNDGVGEGTLLTTALSDFTFTINGTGIDLDLEFQLTSTDGFEPIVVDNVRVSEAQPAVVITQTGGGTTVAEAGTTTDTYTLRLDTTPTDPVMITVTAPADVLVSADGVAFGATAMVTLSDATTLATITVRAVDDTDIEGVENITLTHTAISADGDYDGIAINNVIVSVADNDVLPTPIYQIQGENHISPLNGQLVTTTGIVTARDTNGFYLQDPTGDGNDATSDGIFVFTSSAPTVAVGDNVEVTGTVSEFIPGGGQNLGITQISGGPTVTVINSGNALPAATIIGSGGRVPPNQFIDDPAFNTDFEPTIDGADFFESLEGMRVTAQNLVSVSPNFENSNGEEEFFGLVDGGTGATGFSDRGTINIAPQDFNPEKIQIDEDAGILSGFTFPQVQVGTVVGNVTGVVSYDNGNYEIRPTQAFTPTTPSTLTPETTTLTATANALTVASYNVLNLDPNDAPGETQADADIADDRFTAIAQQIVNNLGTPDIIGLQEIQDNSGGTDNGITAADVTLQTLITAIEAAGGPTYSFIDNTFILDGQSGGQPGGNIRTAFLYNPSRVSLVAGSVGTISEAGAFSTTPASFFNSRPPIVATFTFNGEDFTVINNHFSSKGGSAPIFGSQQDFGSRQEDTSINGSLNERRQQAQAVNNYIDTVLAGEPNANIVVTGDFNEFEFVSPLSIVAGSQESSADGQSIAATGLSPVLTNLTNSLPEDERYSFIFQGNSQSLDHILVSNNLAGTAQVDIVHTNIEFPEETDTASDHDPVVARINLPANFTLQLLHASDFEAGVPALEDAPRFSAVLNALRDDFPNTLFLSSGDNYIPSPFLFAGSDPSLNSTPVGVAGIGHADIEILNQFGLQASAFGNHEFDLGTREVRDIIQPSGAYRGATFPYLSANLNFATDSNLSGRVVANEQEASSLSAGRIAESTVITVNGARIGIVGATTPTLPSISSPGTVGVLPANPLDFDALAAEIQTAVDDVIDGADDILGTADDINKVILLSHMQQLAIERDELAPRLRGVDIIVAGGSHTLLSDATDRLRLGDISGGAYPILTTDADNNPVAVVNTDANYRYLGRLVVDFDSNGLIDPNSIDAAISGAYATDDQGVTEVNGVPDPEVVQIVDALDAVITGQDGNTFGFTNVFLRGDRNFVRTEETNLGNITADANLNYARTVDATTVISLKNGGGIRSNIGVINAAGGSTNPDDFDLLPPVANPAAGKEEGEVSQLDITNSLRFNNGLTLVTLTAAQVLQVIEHSVAATAPGATPGQFGQVGGLRFSFDPTRAANDRVLSLAVVNEQGTITDVIARDGELVGDPNRTFRTVTLNFLANGGDSYPFQTFLNANPTLFNRVDLLGEPDSNNNGILEASEDLNRNGVRDAAITEPFTGVANFASFGSEQDALAEYLNQEFPDRQNAFNQADTDPALDERIQNLSFRTDTVLPTTVTIVATDANAAEANRDPGVFTVTRTGATTNNLTVNFITTGTATNGSDYDSLSGSVTIPAGEASATITVSPIDDTIVEGNETVILTLSNNSSYTVGAQNNATVTIADNDQRISSLSVTSRTVSTGTQLTGGNSSETFVGTQQRDTITAFGGNDQIFAGDGNDSIDGGTGDDFIFGEAGNDTLLGGFGNDSLTGGVGADTLSGGSGRDAFIYNTRDEGGDRITDFVDRVDLILVSTTLASSFGSAFGNINAAAQGANTIVFVEGNSSPGFQSSGDTLLATLNNFQARNFSAADVQFI